MTDVMIAEIDTDAVAKRGSVALSSRKIAASLSREAIDPSTHLAATAISVHRVPVSA